MNVKHAKKKGSTTTNANEINWARLWTVECSQPGLHPVLFPDSGTSKFTLEEHKEGGHVFYKVVPGPGMKSIWGTLELKPKGTQHLQGQTPPHLPRHPANQEARDKAIQKALALMNPLPAAIERLSGTLPVNDKPHEITMLQAVGQLEDDEPMLIIRVKAPDDGKHNPDGSAVGHF